MKGGYTVKIHEFSATESLNGGDQFPIAQNENNYTRKTLLSTIRNWILNNSALTGTPTAPTASSNTNTTQVATTAFVKNEVSNVSTTTELVFTPTTNSYVNVYQTRAFKMGNIVYIQFDVELKGNPSLPTGQYIEIGRVTLPAEGTKNEPAALAPCSSGGNVLFTMNRNGVVRLWRYSSTLPAPSGWARAGGIMLLV